MSIFGVIAIALFLLVELTVAGFCGTVLWCAAVEDHNLFALLGAILFTLISTAIIFFGIALYRGGIG